MSWIKNNTKIIVFFLIALILFLLSKFYLFWIFFPFALCIFFFASIKFYSEKLFLVYPVIILATLCMLYSAGEFYLALSSPKYFSTEEVFEDTYSYDSQNLYLPMHKHKEDIITGYGSTPESKTQARRLLNASTVVYDVTYTIDSHGRRISPNNENSADTAIILLGCSFTFGQGLNDKETFAWQLAQLLGEKYQVYNYAYIGWGSHQMLALLQSDRLDYIQNKYKNVHFFYLTFEGIQIRSSGYSTWDIRGPVYVLDENNTLQKLATFGSTQSETKLLRLRGKWISSLLAEKIVTYYNQRHTIIDSSMERLSNSKYSKVNLLDSAIVMESEKVAKEKFPNSTFTVVMYNNMPQSYEILSDNGMDILHFEDTFTGNDADDFKIPLDGHPNAKATTIIADKYYQYIMESF